MNANSLFVIILLVLQIVLDKVFLTSDSKIGDTEGGKIFNWTVIILVLLLLASTFLTPTNQPNPIFALLITIISAFRTFMEWKYNKESNSHVSQLILTIG